MIATDGTPTISCPSPRAAAEPELDQVELDWMDKYAAELEELARYDHDEDYVPEDES